MTLVGIVGGGQLGMMLAEAGARIGIECLTLDPAPDSPASRVAPAIVGAYDDEGALAELAAAADVVTYEFENVPVASARFLAERVDVFPPPESLEFAQDRVLEKTLFEAVGLAVAPFSAVSSRDELAEALEVIGVPSVLKTRRLGYDGKGQARLASVDEADDAWRAVGEVPSILESLVPFERELSILGVRGRDGRAAFYPLVENVHRDGILRVSTAPALGVTAELQATAERHALAVMERLGHVGVLAIELFQVGEEPPRQRDGPPRPQLRSLDDRGRGDVAVREPSAGDLRDGARSDVPFGLQRHGEHHRLGPAGELVRARAPGSPSPVRQGISPGTQAGTRHRHRTRRGYP